jgi:hypothetical protein
MNFVPTTFARSAKVHVSSPGLARILLIVCAPAMYACSVNVKSNVTQKAADAGKLSIGPARGPEIAVSDDPDVGGSGGSDVDGEHAPEVDDEPGPGMEGESGPDVGDVPGSEVDNQPLPNVDGGVRPLPSTSALATRLGTTNFEVVRIAIPTTLGATLAFVVGTGNKAEPLVLSRLSARGPNFQVLMQNTDGSFANVSVPEVPTYVGHIQGAPTASVFVTFDADGIRGRIETISGAKRITRLLEPIRASEQASIGRKLPPGSGVLHAVYPKPVQAARASSANFAAASDVETVSSDEADVMPAMSVSEVEESAQKAFLGPGPTVTVKRAEIGFDVGYSFLRDRCGSNTTTAVRSLEAFITNTVNSVYVGGSLIEHVIGKIVIRPSAARDPYNGLVDGDAILRKIRDIWNGKVSGFPSPSKTHSLAHVALNQQVTKVLNGASTGLIGLAWPGTIGSELRYSLGTAKTGMGYWLNGSRHEIGHNWSLKHGDGCPDKKTPAEPTPWSDFMGVMCAGFHERPNSIESSKMLSHRNAVPAGVLVDIGRYPATKKVAPYGAQDVGTSTTAGAGAIAIDVLANDHDANGDSFIIDALRGVKGKGDVRVAQNPTPTPVPTTLGGTVVRSVGTGPEGRDRLLYTPPKLAKGNDEFHYFIRDPSGLSGWGYVRVSVK